MIAAVRKKIEIGLQVMIRPRGGDFCYSADEFGIMQRDILIAKQLGANGVVFGILDLDGKVLVGAADAGAAVAAAVAAGTASRANAAAAPATPALTPAPSGKSACGLRVHGIPAPNMPSAS